MPRNNLEIEFSSSQSSEINRMIFTWAPGFLTYNIDNQDPVRLEIKSNKLEYNNKKTLILWANCVSRKTQNDLTLENFSAVRIGVNFIGIISLYSRDLTKLEIIEHYVKYHVKAFTHNEVLS